jgi:NhaP-type Na+/H+ or K+/H+ antiporter
MRSPAGIWAIVLAVLIAMTIVLAFAADLSWFVVLGVVVVSAIVAGAITRRPSK